MSANDAYQQAMNAGHSAAWDQIWDQAAESYRAALKLQPNDAKALSSLALVLFQMQQYEESLQCYIQVARQSPDDPVPVEKSAQIYERIGQIPEAVAAALAAAEIYLKLREPEKAIENWARVTQLQPEHLQAHSRLALVHEKMGQIKPAVAEYIAMASLLQSMGNPQKAAELIAHSLKIAPESAEAKQAMSILRAGQMLPKPVRSKGGTGPLRMAQVKQFEDPKQVESTLDPISDARQAAMKVLAEALFELSDESPEAQQRRGLQAIMRGTGQLSMQQSEQTKILLHLSAAIDAQTRNQEDVAADELERAMESGFAQSALYFDLGYLRYRQERLESALRNLQNCIKHKDYGLAARLLSGKIMRQMNRLNEAGIEYLEALKIADSLVVPAEKADEIRQLYEPLVEAQASEQDEARLTKLCDNLEEMLHRPNWREHLKKMRAQLPKAGEDSQLLPLAEIIIQAQSSQVIESMTTINQMARSGTLRLAMDEAYYALAQAPTYLPLHTLMGDLLVREGRPQDAIAKFSTVAHAYSVRGEAAQATNLLKRIIQISPMDLSARTKLIDQLSERGQVNEALAEYVELADIYYRLAELDMARKTYTTALRLAQQPNAARDWNLRILQRMADIDMQRLDWKQALRVFEQIRTLKPDDENARKNLVDLKPAHGTSRASHERNGKLHWLPRKRRTHPRRDSVP
jgi:tetratricopeptide (TPR) repeat protein